MLSYSAYFKDSSFQNENEWRIVITNTGDARNKNRHNVKNSMFSYIPYFEVDFNPSEFIKEVIVSPGSSDRVFDSVVALCSTYGIEYRNGNITKSKIPVIL